MNDADRRQFEASVREELEGRLMPFWLERSVDDVHGGFIGWMSNTGRIDALAPKGLILNARLLWTFSALCKRYPTERCGVLAQRAYDYLTTRFWDADRGGAFWQVDARGAVLDDTKKIYGQAFMIYALAQYAQIQPDAEALPLARSLFERLEHDARDARYGGYFEVCQRDWTVIEQSRLSSKDLAAPKSMNNHLHLLEAYTTLYRVWPETQVADALRELIRIFQELIIDANAHQRHFFDEQWHPLSTAYTYGHDIEASWLLCEAADVLGDADLCLQVRELALLLARHALNEGIDASGGLCYAGDHHRITNNNKEWWPQAECVVGFLNAYQRNREASFEKAARAAWDFIQRSIVDRQHGEWFWRVDAQGRPDRGEPKVSMWKGPYHNVRACLEILQRLRSLNGEHLGSANALQDASSAAL